MAFFSAADIVVSAHGAQNVGIGFMPQCGGVLELFPRGINFPTYFGALATYSGLEYMDLYVSNATVEQDRGEGILSSGA